MADHPDVDGWTGEPTAPYRAPTLDTGGFTMPPAYAGTAVRDHDPFKPLAAEVEPAAGLEDQARPAVVPGGHQHLKRWTFLLVLAGVWALGAAAGLGLYYWWFHSLDKTPAVFVTLVYVVACAVGSLVAAMAQNRPLVTALGIAVMSAPLASMAAAAVLYGGYVFGWIGR